MAISIGPDGKPLTAYAIGEGGPAHTVPAPPAPTRVYSQELGRWVEAGTPDPASAVDIDELEADAAWHRDVAKHGTYVVSIEKLLTLLAELRTHRLLVDALIWLPETTINFSDLEFFLDEARERGWTPGAGAAATADDDDDAPPQAEPAAGRE